MAALVGPEIIRRILRYLPFLPGVTRKHIKTLSEKGEPFTSALQPYLFQHVNLRELAEAFEFFSILKKRSHILPGIHTLQVSFTLDANNFEDAEAGDEEDDKTNSEGGEGADWMKADVDRFHAELKTWLPLMTYLHTLILGFDEEDYGFLHRFLEFNGLDSLSQVRKIHLLSFSPEAQDQVGADPGPWDDPDWLSGLWQLPTLRYLIISTHNMPFWPPTHSQAENLRSCWFRTIPMTFNLQTVVLHCGDANEQRRLSSYAEGDQNHGSMPRTLEYPPETNISYASYPGNICNPFIIWTKCADEQLGMVWTEGSGNPYCGYGEHLYLEEL
ncbi:hypothetical protein DFH07DRAFT_785585 [Mycena maculata]|uniref:Uncharacterized protein n=1 Tax=Mycena maculata TaxID=230809 RepID=A0AAD7H9D1_9AGAR|nr:hypothetical protein DFH07DRAFT_785585 [Mycena maculata]